EPGRTLQSVDPSAGRTRSEEHTSELQSLTNLVCRLLLEKKNIIERTEHQAVTFGRGTHACVAAWISRAFHELALSLILKGYRSVTHSSGHVCRSRHAVRA